MATRRINGFPKTTTNVVFRLCVVYICLRAFVETTRAIRDLDRVLLCLDLSSSFEIDDLSSDQVKENDSKRRARALLLLPPPPQIFGLNYYSVWSVVFKNIRVVVGGFGQASTFLKLPKKVFSQKVVANSSSSSYSPPQNIRLLLLLLLLLLFSQQRQNRKRRAHLSSKKKRKW